MIEQIWLKLDEHTEVAIPLQDALRYDEKDFAKLYRTTVYKASRKEARAWGKEQVAKRARAYKEATDEANL